MDSLFGWILITGAILVVAVMVWMVSSEKHVHEQHYNPDAPRPDDDAPVMAAPSVEAEPSA